MSVSDRNAVFLFETTQRQSSGSAYFELSPLPTALRRAESQGSGGFSVPRNSLLDDEARGSSRASSSYSLSLSRGEKPLATRAEVGDRCRTISAHFSFFRAEVFLIQHNAFNRQCARLTG